MPIYLKMISILLIPNFYNSMQIYFNNSVWSCPSRLQFFWKQLELGIEQQYMLPLLEVLCQNVPIMAELGLLLVYFCILISIHPLLIKFVQLERPSLCTCLGINVGLLYCPICFVFQLKWQVTSFSKHNSVRCHSYWCFKSCPICLQSII